MPAPQLCTNPLLLGMVFTLCKILIEELSIFASYIKGLFVRNEHQIPQPPRLRFHARDCIRQYVTAEEEMKCAAMRCGF